MPAVLTRRRLASGLSLALLAGLVVFLAVNADGRPRHEMALNDASVWVTNRAEAKMARLNSQIGQLDQGITVADAPAFDVEQHRETVLLNAAPRLDVIDVASVEAVASITVPAAAEARLGRTTVAIWDRDSGSVWVHHVDDLGSYSAEEAPVLTAGPDAQAVVTDSDDVLVLDVTDGSLSRIDGRSREVTEMGVVPSSAQSRHQLSAVGDRPVVLDLASRALLQPGADPIDLPGVDDDTRVQQAGPAADEAFLATSTAAIAVPLDGGDPQVTEFGGSGPPAAPLRLNACVHLAWADPDAESYLQRCEGADDVRAVIGEVAASADLRFRSNRNVVVLNDVLSGHAWMPQDQMRLVNNWDDINAEREPERTDTVVIDEIERTEENRRPVLQPDFLGARPDRDTILRVLANDADPDGDLLTITGVQMEPGSAADADAIQIVGHDTELQLALDTDASGEIRFSYTASDGRPGGEASADVVVEIREPEQNAPPELRHGPPTAQVAAGRSVTTFVLGDWEDPDGDDLFLESATAPEGGEVSYRPDGLVTYTHEGDEAGTAEVEIEVSDGRESTTGVLEVEILPPGAQAPEAVPDHVTATVGQQQLISPLLNDVSVDGEDLVLSSISPSTQSSLGGTAVPGLALDEQAGTFTFEADAEGTYFVDYTVRTSGPAARSTVRIDVRPPREDNRAPIAVKDRADVPLGGQALVDVLANDSDPDGDLLAIASVEIPDDLPIKVGVVDRRLLRIEAPVDLSDLQEAGEARFSYTVSDGQDSDTAEVIVHQYAPADRNRAPIAADDEVTVRSGDVATVRVLDNDRDPDGDPLTLVPEGLTSEHPELEVLFVAGDTVRVQGPDVDEPQRFRAVYEVTDPYGRSATATIRINVNPDDPETNRAPVPRVVEGRAIAGKTTRIPIPMDGIDPDGDSVRFLGLVSGPSLGYIAASGPGWIEYVAYSVDEGGGGVDTFAVALADRYGATATAPVEVVVSPRAAENHPPVAMDDHIRVRPGRTVHMDVLANDTDADNDSLTLVGGDDSELGRSVITVQAPDEPGQVTQRYSVWDGYGGIDSAVLTVEAAEDAPLHPPVAVDDVAHPAQVAGREPGDSIRVDVLANDYDPDAEAARLRLDSDDAQVTDGVLQIELTAQTRIVRYRITDEDDLTSYGFVTVVGTDEVAPVVDPAVLDADGRARVDVGETLTLALEESVLVRHGHEVVVPEDGLLRSSVGSIERIDESTVAFDSTGVAPGVVTLTVEVADDGDPALSSVIALPVAVHNPENVAPIVEPLSLDLAARDTQGILLTPQAYITDPDARDEPRCRIAASGDIVVQQQGEGCSLIVRPAEDAVVPSRAVIDVEVTDDQGAQGRGEIQVNLAERIDLTSRVRFPDFVAERGRELRVDIDDYVTDEADRGRLSVVAAGQHRVNGSVIVVRPTELGSFTVPVTLRTPGGTTISSGFRVAVGARPGAPSRPEVERTESGAVHLRWTAPESNGYPIDAYFVEAEGLGTRECPPTPQCRIGGLDNGRDYVFRVTARNELGRGPASPSSAPARPDETPAQMRAPSVEYLSDDPVGVRLSWEAPANRGSAIVAYEIQRSDTGTIERVSAGSRSWTDTSVRAGGSYRYQIRALNGTAEPQDFSPWADAEPYGRPSAPGQPSAEAVGTGTRQDHRVSWPAADARGAPIEQYEVRVSGRGASSAGTSTSLTVPELRVGQTYTIEVRARNRAGWGSWSPSIQVMPTAAPLAPDAPRVEMLGEQRARISWSYRPDGFNGGGDRRFRIVDDLGATLERQVNANTREATVRLRDPGQERRIRIVAVNDRGATDGAWSSSVTPIGEPGSPDVTVEDPAGNEVTFGWTEPRTRGGSIAGYQVRYRYDCRNPNLFDPCAHSEIDPRFGDPGRGEWSEFIDHAERSISLTGANVNYRVQVRAYVRDHDGSRRYGDAGGSETSGWLDPPAPGGTEGVGAPASGSGDWSFLWGRTAS